MIRMFCDVGGEELKDTDVYFELTLDEKNSRGHQPTFVQVGAEREMVQRSIDMICVSCARRVAEVTIGDKTSGS